MSGAMRVLVTGGAGFIGSHVVDRLLEAGHRVTVLDSLDPQVHGSSGQPPDHLAREAELVRGDVRDGPLVARLVGSSDAVLHLAAAVGVAQSMYQMERFVDVNCRGTAVLLDAVVRARNLGRVVVASSMSLYGEGRCRCPEHGEFDPPLRSPERLARGDFELRCPRCGAAAEPVPTPEDARLRPTTVYAVTKRDQEELALAIGAAYKVPTLALRLFNVYGPRQSLSNPYTGVGAIFCASLLGGSRPLVFEDGRQTRDFTHVSDAAGAFVRALERPEVDGLALNVGAGGRWTLLDLGRLLAAEIGVPWAPEVTGSFREGDIRHCTADTSALGGALGLRPSVDLTAGVRDLVAWVRTQRRTGSGEAAARALAELTERGLVQRRPVPGPRADGREP